MKYFAIFFILIGFVGFAHAEFNSSILGPFSDNDIVAVGTVVQIIEDGDTTQYDIKVEEYLKGQLSFDLITATLNQVRPSDFPQDPFDYFNKPFFEKDNQVLVYLRQDGGTFEMSPYSFTIKKSNVAGPPSVIHAAGPQHINSQGDEIILSGTIKKGYMYSLEKSNLDSDFVLVVLDENEKQVESKKLLISPDGSYSFSFQDKGELRIPGKYSWEISFWNGNMGGTFFVTANLQQWTPLKQFKSGVLTEDIQCKENMVLLKKHDDSPACVKPDSVIELIKRNWLVTEGVQGYAIDYDGDVKHLPFADVCTDEMKILLVTYSNIATPDEQFVMDDVALPSAMNSEDFARCAHETEFTKSRWNMISMENHEPVPMKCKSGPAPTGDYYFDDDTCDWIERKWYEGDQFEKIVLYCTDPESNPNGEIAGISKGGEIKLDSKKCLWLHGGFYNQVWVEQTTDPVPLIQNGNVMSPEGKILRSVK